MQILHILKSTPFYVYLLFGYLIFIGIKATHERISSLPKLLINPFILLCFSIQGLSNIKDLIIFFMLLSIFIIMYWRLFDKPPIQINNNLIVIPGSWQPLVFMMIIFSLKYYFGYLKAVNPEIAKKYKIIELLISSCIMGFMFFKTIYYCYNYIIMNGIKNKMKK